MNRHAGQAEELVTLFSFVQVLIATELSERAVGNLGQRRRDKTILQRWGRA